MRPWPSSTACGSVGAARTSAASRRSRCSTPPPCTRPAATCRGSGPRPGATTWSIAQPTPRQPDDTSHVKALEDAGARTFRGNARIVAKGRRRGCRFGRRRTARARSRQHHRRDGFELEGAADRGPPRDAPVDEPAGHPHARAAAQPARPRWRPDRRRAQPGLRPLRRADDDRPVRSADPSHGQRPRTRRR